MFVNFNSVLNLFCYLKDNSEHKFYKTDYIKFYGRWFCIFCYHLIITTSGYIFYGWSINDGYNIPLLKSPSCKKIRYLRFTLFLRFSFVNAFFFQFFNFGFSIYFFRFFNLFKPHMHFCCVYLNWKTEYSVEYYSKCSIHL